MARWFAKRWVWAALAGAAVTVGTAASLVGREGPPKVGSVVSLNIDGKGERQFKVLKSDRQPDGTYLSELKDTKTGETITLVDRPDAPAPAGAKVPEPPKAPEAPRTEPPKAKSRPADPLVPPVGASMPDPSKDGPREKDKRPLLGRIFGDKAPAPAPAAPAAEMPSDPAKKPGLFGRVFGPKKPAGPGMPAPTAGPVVKPSPSAPPAVIPTPPGGVTGAPNLPPFPVTGGAAGSTAEPPRVTPAKPAPVAPPMPAVPAPSIPSAPPLPVPMPPAATPSFPAPSVPVPMPALPTPMPPAGGVPPIPVPPGGTSAARPIEVVVPAGFVPAGIAFDREVQPFVVALQTMAAPSARLTAAKGLADGRHASSEGVKAALFQAAQLDPCGEVRAACIDHLCKLGYFSPNFLAHIQAACQDADPMVRDAAKVACGKMLRSQK